MLEGCQSKGKHIFCGKRKKIIDFGKAHGKKKQKMGKLKFKVAAALREDYRQMDQIFFKEI